MRYDAAALRAAQRGAFNLLKSTHSIHMVDGKKVKGERNPYYTNPQNITMPAQIIQEQAYVTTTQQYIFDFSINQPPATPALGNVLLGKNNVMAIYGIQLFIGYGANANNRSYQSHGLIPADDAVYNSVITMKMEQSVLVDRAPGIKHRDVGETVNYYDPNYGLVLINPIRLINGNLGTFQVTINLINSITALVLSPNAFLSMRLEGAFGQASATK